MRHQKVSAGHKLIQERCVETEKLFKDVSLVKVNGCLSPDVRGLVAEESLQRFTLTTKCFTSVTKWCLKRPKVVGAKLATFLILGQDV